MRSIDIGDACCASVDISSLRNGLSSRFSRQELVQLVELVLGRQRPDDAAGTRPPRTWRARRGRRCRSRRTRGVPARRRCRRSLVSAATISRSPFSVTCHILHGARRIQARAARARICQDSRAARRRTKTPHDLQEDAERVAASRHADPRRRDRPRGDRGGSTHDRGHRRRGRVGAPGRWAPARSRGPGDPCPPQTLDVDPLDRVALKGPIETPVTSGLRSANLELRKTLDLFANVRPCRLYPGVPSVYEAGRPGRGPREHRGHVHGLRVRDGHRRGARS